MSRFRRIISRVLRALIIPLRIAWWWEARRRAKREAAQLTRRQLVRLLAATGWVDDQLVLSLIEADLEGSNLPIPERDQLIWQRFLKVQQDMAARLSRRETEQQRRAAGQ